jgi:feruloyl esterase
MDRIPADRDRVKELFQTALDLEPSLRAAFLAKNCHDVRIREEVEALLRNYQEAGSFLNEPIWNRLWEGRTTEGSSDSKGLCAPFTTAPETEVIEPMTGRRLGAYKIVRRIGHGGMAAVFLATRADDEYQKQVAIKLVQPGLDSPDLLNRFRNERQTLADLDHPNIVKLLDGGSTPEGLPFLVMDYVEGTPVDDYCDRHKLSVDDRLRMFSKVCEAVQYAHQKSVVHRDLKPSNILVTDDGTPKVLDFGIAKVLNPPSPAQALLLTQTGTRCMTPAYASPEQMRGKSITTATDIYSLGVVLYELLSGHRPYRLKQNTPAEIERAICEAEPEPPSTAVSRVESEITSSGVSVTKTPELVSETRESPPEKLRRHLRGDLDNIVLKALQKEPERRYSSVEEFSQDIQRHLQHLPVKARRGTLAYRASKFVRRHNTQIVAASVGVVLLILGALVEVNRLLKQTSTQRAQQLGSAPTTTNPTGWLALGGLTAKSAVPCENLGSLTLPSTTITLAQSVPVGSLNLSGGELVRALPAFCRVEGVIKPTDDSKINFAVWMPVVGWNRRFRGVGNYGFAGEINFADMAPALRSGYATASTDTGHRGGQTDTEWAIGHPERVADFGYRAVHEMTEKAKMIIRSFYGQAPQLSLFEGSSNGAREGLIEAQRFPADYQGILVGDPPISVSHALTAALYNSYADPPAYIPASKLPAISAAVLAACDALDGISDGLLNDPRQCHFDPSVLRCHSAESDSCLTSAQVTQLNKIYTGLRNSKAEQLFPGYLPGGEEGDYGWETWIIGDGPGKGLMPMYALNYFRDMVFENPKWDFRTVSAERAAEVADSKTARLVNATDPDLHQFKANGGKLILYHGWSDAGIPGTEAINYYDSVIAKIGLEETQSFVRLYMAPGMHHGFLGPGPNFFGQVDIATLGGRVDAAIPTDPQHNISIALVQWADKGIAPNAIIATKYVNDSDPSQGVKMTRPLCPYPQIAVYKGAGDTNDAANFACSQPNNQHRRMLSPQTN